ncbi:glycosyltransferase family 4 protein [Lichenicoccus sp.]|uniref:glycosyltransferase family 4 protein n=1 Tax=Lichenicoccus sp. TaxID=2781899 RepID=UPI003D11404F
MPGSSAAFKPLHRLWRRLPPGSRRLWLARLSSALAPAPDRAAPRTCDGIIVAGEIARASGLGESARIMSRALEALQVRAWPMQAALTVPGETLEPIAAPTTTPSATAALVLHVNAPVLGSALLRLPRGLPRGRRMIGYWAWELQAVPPSWRPAGRLVHEVWVPSRFTAQAIEPLLPGRVRVVPHALALAPPCPARMDRAAFGLPEQAVLVLVSFSLASAFERKNPLAAIAAFRKAFGKRCDRILVLKVGHAAHYAQDMQRLREAADGAPNIHLETRMLTAAETHALTRLSDIVLSLHRSEGFGLVPAEAMMLGRAVVATDWSATTEFLDAQCGMPIGYRLVPARDPRGISEAEGAVWAEADTDQAARALAVLADAPERRAALGDAAQRAAATRFGGDGLRQALTAIGCSPRTPA